MVETIYELKNKLLEEMMQDVQERGIERLDKEKVDMVKDLADAEKSCWEAEYYRNVSEAMEGQSGYPQGGQGGSGYAMGMGYPQGGQGGRSGGSSGRSGGSSGGSSGYPGRRGSRRGYGMSGYPMDDLKMKLQNADPQEREQMMQELRQMMGGQM